MKCRNCGHEPGWHGDRAIGGCDGGWNLVNTMNRPRRQGDPVALCSCPGWRADLSC